MTTTATITPLEPGMLATVVTSLEMRGKPRPRPMTALPFVLRRWAKPSGEKYRALFRRVGEPWLWFSRLVIDDAALDLILHDDAVEVYGISDRQGIEIGLLELDFRISGETEIAFFGIIPELAGKGIGSWLMGHALSMAWRKGIARVWVHSCTLDHPSALAFYRKHGFTPFARAIEIFPDPRTTGVIRAEAAPQIPLIQSESAR